MHHTGSNPVLTLKIKIMKNEKNYYDGAMDGFAATVIIYSLLLGIAIIIFT
jgi:hypothetical protein